MLERTGYFGEGNQWCICSARKRRVFVYWRESLGMLSHFVRVGYLPSVRKSLMQLQSGVSTSLREWFANAENTIRLLIP